MPCRLRPRPSFGTINVTLGDESVVSRDLITLGAVEEAGFFGSMADGMRMWFDSLFEEDEEQQPE